MYIDQDLCQNARALPKALLKLVIINNIMMHTLTIVESTREQVVGKLRHRQSQQYGTHTSSRWLNKQIKFLLSTLHWDLLKNALQKIQKDLGASKKTQHWGNAFTGLISVAMTIEAMQFTIRCKEATDKNEKIIPEQDENATREIQVMEEKWGFLKGLFQKRYPKNPIHDEEARKFVDPASQQLAQGLKIVIDNHRE